MAIALGIAAVYIISIAARSSWVEAWQWQFDDLKQRINHIDLMVYKIHSYYDNGWYIQYDNCKKQRKRKPRRRNRGRRGTKPTDHTFTKDEKEIAERILANGEPGLINQCGEIPATTGYTTLFLGHSKQCADMRTQGHYTGNNDCPDPECPWAK